jgi:psp operon transcriptional activator
VFPHFEAIGQAPSFLDFQERVRRVAPVNRPVLLIGERGTGKEMAAQRIHYLSPRWNQPLVTLNCAALSPSLIESELFGHEEGAFTGARRRRMGRFEAARGGTLFLDEISLIPLEVQEKILRVVEYGSFERVGGTETVRPDVRIIGASNVDLSKEAARGRFKRDLLDRLSFEVLFLPPLRERREDIMLLANHFASRMAFELGRDGVPEFSKSAAAQLVSHPWPGNVREIKNVVERAVYRSETDLIEELDFDPFLSPYSLLARTGSWVEEEAGGAETDEGGEGGDAERVEASESEDLWQTNDISLPAALQRVEVHFLRRALKMTRYNQRLAAEALGLTYHQFRGLYRKHADMLKSEHQ